MGLASRQALIAYIFLFPAFIYFTVFFFVPIVIEFWSSLHSDDTGNAFVWFDNYVKAFEDQRSINSFVLTLVFAISVTILSMVFGLFLALLLNQSFRGRTILRTILLIPYMTSAVIVGLMWRNILDPLVGILNKVLIAVGLPTQDWLSNYKEALWALVGITVWQAMGYNMVLFLAGLQGIPTLYQEAAKIDGANAWGRFRHITIPLLAPTTLFVSIISVISSLQAFAQAFIITNGGPAESTRFYVFHVFNVAFSEGKFAYASALTFLMFLAILVLTFIQLRVNRNGVEY
ncbi:MAG: sugar ABC transporter permease [Chloroflexi bacterium]|nr:sugar ABC transporter permease [Chloroflexota bacterium]